ncbi:MAG TPA: hypothetical protein VFY93_14485 [Planctomycetota bacterium]|nr:hypothetical protein [Planctomycetota bacterium]
MRGFSAFFLLVATAVATPLTPEKVELIPGLYPKERRELKRRLAGRTEGAREALVEAGVDPRVAERIERLPPGPLLVERYAAELPLEAPDLTQTQRELLQHLHPAVLAAEWALVVERERLVPALKDEPTRRQVAESFDRQVREIEKRYWRVVGAVLTEAQRAAIHPLLPQPYQRPPDLAGHVYQAPGLTVAQAGRIRALVAEYESESAADAAEARRLKQGPGYDAAVDRLGDLLRRIVTQASGILTPEQLRYIDALPPLVGPNERGGEFVLEMGLTPEQQERAKPLIEETKRKVDEARRVAEAKVRAMQGEVSGESPQAMTMQMMQQEAAGDAARIVEDAARKGLLEILDKKQVLGWILSPR